MNKNSLVFYENEASDEAIVEQAINNPIMLDARDADVSEAGRSVEGEVWSPQLLPYRSWASAMRDVEGDDNGEAAKAAWRAGKDSTMLDSDLLAQVASHRAGKEAEVGAAAGAAGGAAGGVAAGAAGAGTAAGAAGVAGAADGDGEDGAAAGDELHKGDLYSAGAMWAIGRYDDLLAAAQREDMGGSAAVNEALLDRTLTGLRDAIRVRPERDGYALVGFDLRRFATAVGRDDELVVVLPSYVGGVPVVRVSAEAFARRYVQGIGVRLLVIPDTVKRVGANAFLAASARRIHIGRNVELLGEQRCDLAGVSPRLARREYSVDPRNAHFTSVDGSLFGNDGRDLLFLASPYDEHEVLPEGVELVASTAFADGCEAPALVDCPASLARADSKAWDEAVWRCSEEAPVRRAFALRGVRMAGPNAVKHDGCWYDFDEEGAVLVAGPPKPVSVSRSFAELAAVRAVAVRSDEGAAAQDDGLSPFAIAAQAANEFAASGEAGSTVDYVSASLSEVLALLRQVEGRPLVRNGVRALPWAPASVVVPDTVRVIERDNACRGTKRLVLPEGLESIGAHCFWSRKLNGPVSVPASVSSVGEGSFEYAVCRLEHTGTVVHVSADQLLSCFLTELQDGVPFDFKRYDELLLSGKNLPDRLGALLHRLASPFKLEDSVRASLVSQLRAPERLREAQQRVAREGDRAMVEALVKAGFIDEETFDRQIELLRACNRTDCVLYLMEQHRQKKAQDKPASAKARFAL